MGMFDDVKCKYPLPIDGANALEFQSKDTPAQALDHYEIREDGSLWHQDYDIEDRSDPTKDGLMGLRGMLTPVNKRWAPVSDFRGELRFYTFWDSKFINSGDAGWIEFSALFNDGKLVDIRLIENRPASKARNSPTVATNK